MDYFVSHMTYSPQKHHQSSTHHFINSTNKLYERLCSIGINICWDTELPHISHSSPQSSCVGAGKKRMESVFVFTPTDRTGGFILKGSDALIIPGSQRVCCQSPGKGQNFRWRGASPDCLPHPSRVPPHLLLEDVVEELCSSS